MSAHARVYIRIDNVGTASMNNWMPDAIKALNEWLYDEGFDINDPFKADRGTGPNQITKKEQYFVEVESTSCSYDVFDYTYITHTIEGWLEEFKELRYQYEVYNLDIEPDLFIVRETVGGRPSGYDSRGN
jgi:hypothetical protein